MKTSARSGMHSLIQRRLLTPSASSIIKILTLLLLVVTYGVPSVRAEDSLGLGGEIKTFNTTFARDYDNPILSTGYRLNVCNRFEQYFNGTLDLRNALSGLQISTLMQYSASRPYFVYNDETGINADYPGIMAELMDELAKRAGFTWRNSFGIFNATSDKPENASWTETLKWSVTHFDVAVNLWDKNIERLEEGITFVEPWFDGSIILVSQVESDGRKNAGIWNFLKPFELSLWLAILVTVLAGAVVNLVIELLTNDRQDRSWSQWISDNLYLSTINLTQAYEYGPTSTAGRIFGVSMCFWALILCATYTANLASLLVESNQQQKPVDSIEQATALGIPICVYAETATDDFFIKNYPKAKRVPKPTDLDVFQGLFDGSCGLALAQLSSWEAYQNQKAYNPTCNLQYVGRTIQVVQSGFATKAEVMYLCSSLIQNVLNLHLNEIKGEGVLEELWIKQNAQSSDINCDASAAASDDARRRLSRKENSIPFATTSTPEELSDEEKSRLLRVGTLSATQPTTAADEETDSLSLTLHQMSGTFILHFSLMGFALLVAFYSKLSEKPKKYNDSTKTDESSGSAEEKSNKNGSRKDLNGYSGDPIAQLQRRQEEMQLTQQKMELQLAAMLELLQNQNRQMVVYNPETGEKEDEVFYDAKAEKAASGVFSRFFGEKAG